MRAVTCWCLLVALRIPATASAVGGAGAEIELEVEADEPRALVWDEHWSRIHWVEYPLILAMATFPVWGGFVSERGYPETGNIRGGWLIDEPIRDVLVLQTRGARETAAQISDWIWLVTQYY